MHARHNDFNIYHSKFEENDIKFDKRNEILLNIVNEFKLQQNVFKKIKIYQFDTHRFYHSFNFYFTTQNLIERIFVCEIRVDLK